MFENSLSFALELDRNDPLKSYRERFYIPEHQGKPVVYLTGNSLGLQPKTVRQYIEQELLDWQNLGVDAHFDGKNPWFSYHKLFEAPVSRLVGALPHEVVMMNTLSVNNQLMLMSFFRPTATRYKIMIEGGAFPSDYYSVESQMNIHGIDPEDAIIELMPAPGEHTLSTEYIIQQIKEAGDSLALVFLGGVNYYTGQAFDMKAITAAAHSVGAYAGFDLAHAAGNLKLQLHDWDVDFATWCTYKYLNSGPGGVSGVFVNERFADRPDIPRLAGWWGYDEASRFQMKKGFIPMHGAAGWQLSNAQILPMAAHKASLDIFDEVGMDALRAKSDKLTAYMEYLINDNMQKQGEVNFTIITPANPADRGAQLSILALKDGKALFNKIMSKGVIADWREPNVIRVAPVPLYNTFEDVYRFVEILFS